MKKLKILCLMAISVLFVGCIEPTIIEHPKSQVKKEGDSVTFTVVADSNGAGALNYVWQFNEVNIEGAPNSASYTISNLDANLHSGSYRVVVASTEGVAVSNPALLSVEQALGEDTKGPIIDMIVPHNLRGQVTFELMLSDASGIQKSKIYINGLSEQLVSDNGGTNDFVAPYKFTVPNMDIYAGTTIKLTAIAFDNSPAKNSNSKVFNIAVPSLNGEEPPIVEPPIVETPTEEPPIVETPTGNEGNASLTFNSDFETGSISGEGWNIQGRNASASIVGSNDIVARSGNKCLKLDIRKGDFSSTEKARVDLNLVPKTGFGFKQGKEYWVGVSMYIPKSFEHEQISGNPLTLWQFHGSGDGSVGKSPPLALRLEGSRLQIVNRTGDANGPSWESKDFWSGTLVQNGTPSKNNLVQGEWNDFVIHFRFEMTGNEGFVQVWKNGVFLGGKYNTTTTYYNNVPAYDTENYVLLSNYKAKWTKAATSLNDPNDRRIVYYDSFRIAEAVGSNPKAEDAGPHSKGYKIVDPANRNNSN